MANTKGGNIKFGIDFQTNDSGLKEASKGLQNIMSQIQEIAKSQGLDDKFKDAAVEAQKLESIISSSWNDKLGQLNLDKFNQSIKNSYGSAEGLRTSLEKIGPAGQTAFNAIASQVLNTNIQLKEGKTLLDEMAETMGNTIKWGISSSVFNNITSAIQQAFYYAKDLDRQLTNIRIVTGDSADQMERFAKTANETAKDLGRSTLDYTKAATSFYQQGLGDEQVAARTRLTLMAQNITGAGSQMVDYLTSVWNGFQVGMEDAEKYVDKLAKVADSSASDMNELAKAMSKVSATANLVGVDADQLNAMLATVIATTRQAPEAVGTAFKTIFTRINDIKTGAEDAEISLGNYSSKMASLGFNVLDANGKLRDTGQVLEQIGSRWETLSKEQQVYLAQIMGGQRQITQVSALFQNWGMYTDLLNDSLNSEGALLQKNNIYLESTAAHMEKLGTEKERTADILFDAETVNTFVDALTGALDIFNDFIEGIGGGINTFTYFGSVVAGIFNKQIAQSILNAEKSLENFALNKNLDKIKQDYATQIAKNSGVDYFQTEKTTVQQDAIIAKAREQANIYTETLKARQGLTAEQQKELTLMQQEYGHLKQQEYLLKHIQDIRVQYEMSDLTDLESIKQKLKVLKERNSEQSKILSVISQIQNIHSKDVILDEQQTQLRKNLNILYEKGLIDQNQYNAILNQQEGSENIITDLLKQQKIVYEGVNGELKQITTLKKLQEAIDRGDLELIKQQYQVLTNNINNLKGAGQQVVDMQKNIRIASAAGQALTTIGGALASGLAEGATASEKLNATWSGINGTIGACLTLIPEFGPVLSMVWGGVTSIGKAIFEATGLWEKFEYGFKSTEQKIEDLKNKIQEVNDVNKSQSSKIFELESIVEEYEKLSEKVGAYGVNLNNLTDEEKDRYHELTNKFSEYNKEVIAGYDEQGNAIVRGQEALLDTIEILKQAKKEATTAAMGDLDTYYQGIAAKHDRSKEQETQRQLLTRQNELALPNVINDHYSQIGTFINEAENYIDVSWMDKDIKSEWDKNLQLLKISFDQIQKEYSDDLAQQIITSSSVMWDRLQKQMEQKGKKIEDIYDSFLGETTFNATNLSYLTFVQSYTKDVNDVADQLLMIQTKLSETNSYTEEDAYSILKILQYVIGEDQEWQQLMEQADKMQVPMDTIIQSFVDFITDFDANEISPQEVKQKTQNYAVILTESLKNSYSIIENAIDDIDFSNFEGTVQQHKKEAEKIITEEIFPNLKVEDFSTDEQRQALQNLLNHIFDLTGIEIQLNGDGLILNADNIITDAQVEGEKAQEKLQKFLTEKLGFKDLYIQMFDGQKFPTIDISEIFDEEQLKNFSQIMDQIDWSKFLQLTNPTHGEGLNAQNALKAVWQEAKHLKDQMSETVTLDFEVVFNSDEVAKHLESKKKLTDQELKYLELLESEDPILKKIAYEQGRSSDAYIKRMKEQALLGEQYYKKQIENDKQLALNKINTQQAVIDYARKNLSDEDPEQAAIKEELIANAQAVIAEQKAKIIEYDYQIARAENIGLENAKERAKLAEEEAKKKREEQNKKFNNARSGLDNLQSGKAPSSDQLAVILEIERHNERLNQLAQEKGRYSLDYLLELGKQLQAQQKITKEKNEQIIAENNLAIAEKERQIAKLQSSISENEESYNSLLASGDFNAIGQYYQQNLQYKQDIETLNNEIVELQQENADLVDQQNQHMLTQVQIIQNQSKSFESLLEKAKSGGDFTSEQLQSWNQMLNDLGQHFPDIQGWIEQIRDTSLSGTQEYEEAIDGVRIFFNDFVQDQLYGNLSTAWQEIADQINEQELQIKVSADEFDSLQDEINSFLEADKQININISTNAQQEFDHISDQLNQMYQAASKIQQGYQLARSDMELLEQVFPHITDGFYDIGEGLVQLNAEAVEMAISTANAEVAANKEAFVAKLQNEIDLLRNKATIYREMADAAQALASGQVEGEDEASRLRGIIIGGLNKLKVMDSEEASGKQIQHEKTVVEAQSENIQDMAANDKDYYDYVMDLDTKVSRVKIHNRQEEARAASAAERGQIYTPVYDQQPSGFASFTGGNRTGSNKPIESSDNDDYIFGQIEDAIPPGDYQTLANYFYGQANQADTRANQLENLISRINQRYGNTSQGLDNIRNGYGINGPKKEDDNKQDSNSNPNSSSNKPGKTDSSSNSNSGDDQLTDGSNHQEQKIQDPEVLDFLQQERDRYHDIDIQIKNISTDLKRLQKQQSKLTGKDLIANLNKQLAVLQKQTKAQKEKLSIAQIQAEQIQKTLAGEGVNFAEDGTISNYNQILDQKLAAVNALIAHYNTLTAAEQEEFKAVVEAAKQDYQNFKKQMQRYDTLVSDTIPDLQDAIEDSINEQIEIQIQKFKIQVELSLDTAEAERKFNQFKKKVIDKISDEDIVGNINSLFGELSSYYKDGFSVIQALTDQVNNTMYEINQIKTKGYSAIYGDNLKQAEEDLKKYSDQLMENLENVQDIIDEIHESIFDAIDAANEAFDEQISKLQYINDLIDHGKTLIELLYGDEAFDQMSEYYGLQQQNNLKNLNFQRGVVEMWRQEADNQKKIRDSLTEGSKEWQEADKILKEYQKKWQDASSSFNSLLESAIKNIIDRYSNGINKLFFEFQKKLTNNTSFDRISEEWQLMEKYADLYLDKINSAYEIQKLQSAYKQAINDNTGNLAAQKSLNKMMEQQLKYLKDKQNLTQYDIDKANALLQIEVKRLALEQARASKTKLRLRRDSQGNYTYQYTADEEQLDKAKDELAKAKNDLWNLTVKENEKQAKDSFSLIKEYMGKIREVYEDTTLSEEQRAARIAQINSRYGKVINGIFAENQIVRQDLANQTFGFLGELYGMDVGAFENMAQAQQDILLDSIVPFWGTGIHNMMDLIQGEGGLESVTQGLFDGLESNVQDFNMQLGELELAAGVCFDNIGGYIQDSISYTEGLLQNNEELIDSYKDLIKTVQDLINKLDVMIQKFGGVATSATTAVQAANGLREPPTQSTYSSSNTSGTTSSSSSSSSSSGINSDVYLTSGSGGSSSSGSSSTSGGSQVSLVQTSSLDSSAAIGSDLFSAGLQETRVSPAHEDPLEVGILGLGPAIRTPKTSVSYSGQNDIKKKKIQSFGTGGYTGNWESLEGRLAFLDKKELVLNKQDTENILSAAEIVRTMDNLLLNLNSMQQLFDRTKINNMLSDTNNRGYLRQHVTIDAHFPNVTNHNEIEKAFKNLVNMASQYAYSNKI